ncbi:MULTISPECIES: apolipoprotein N-acyltransferase [Bartonella]|uniref:apolipoprotein N-acyltransferase n=1 Tax=Bartonella TaxID=773 RepID=UPI0018DB8249|nr:MULTISPECIES: apolipoprotein N-acyltransferase [Bartonella]MBH9974575.1 apolipoprotein N-acyltransferase [Bartonella choladocola]MBI0014182.1 apolipoprotein N-acyltransferase [Bartonella sp. B10834G3]
MQILAKAILYMRGLRGFKRQILGFASGGITAFALTPFYLFPIAFATFPVLVLLLDVTSGEADRKTRFKAAFLTCFSFGFGYFVFGLWWLASAMLVDPLSFAWAIPFAVLGLPFYLALYWGLAGGCAILFWKKGLSRLFTLAFALGIAEYLRATLLTGFPWNAIGYTIMPTPLFMQSDAVVGLYGMNALAVLLYTLPATLFDKSGRKIALTIGVGLFAAHTGFGAIRLYNALPVESYDKAEKWVRLVQPSIKQDEKLDNEVRYAMFEAHMKLSEEPFSSGEHELSYIVWPETAVPYILDYVPEAKTRIASILKPHQWAIVGAVRSSGAPNDKNNRYFNTIETIDGNGNILSSSDKVHLVPFGEYLPFQSFFDKIGLHALAVMAGGYSSNSIRQTVKMPDGFVYLPMICYEVIFPDGMGYKGDKPQAILNVTNDGWFGNTPGPYQHFDQARLRAVELGIPLIRAANNGISAVVDPYGRIVRSLELNNIGVLDSPIPPAIVPIWGKQPNFNQVFMPFVIILILSLIFGFVKNARSIDKF